MKIYELLGDGNGDDVDYIKKTISVKHFKKLINLDYTNPDNKFKEISKIIVANPDYGGNDEFNKPFKLAGVICEFFNRINKYFKIYEENIEIVQEIEELEKQVEKHQLVLSKYLGDYKNLENEVLEIEARISNYELMKANSQAQIDKIKNLIKAYNLFIELTNDKKQIYEQKSEYNLNLLKYFDFYMIYISSYISFAPILNYNYRLKLKNFLLQNINMALEDLNKSKKDEEKIKDINFPELMFSFLDITGKEKIKNYL